MTRVRGHSVGLLVIVLVATALRGWALDYGLPDLVHVDENSYITKRLLGFIGTGDLNPHFFLNPAGFNYLLYLETWVFYLLGSLAGHYSNYTSDMLRLWEEGGRAFFLMARATSALLGTATVGIVYLIGKRLFTSTVGLVAASLLSVNFLHVRDSHFGTNDLTMVFFLTLTFYLAVRIFELGLWRDYVLTGLAAGAASGVKYSAAMVMICLLVAHGLGVLKRREHQFAIVTLSRLAVLGACAVLAFFLTNPYAIVDYEQFRIGFDAQRGNMIAAHLGQDLMPTWLFYLRGLTIAMGFAAVITLFPAWVALLRREPAKFLLLGSFPFAYLAYMCTGNYYFLRFLLPVLPFFCIALAFGIDSLSKRAGARYAIVCLMVTALIGIEPALASVRLDRVLMRRDTRLVAQAWIEDHIPAGTSLYVEGYGPATRLAPTPDHIGSTKYNIVRSGEIELLSYYVDRGVKYFIVSSFVCERFDKFDPEQSTASRRRVSLDLATARSFYEELEERATLLKIVSPYARGLEPDFHLDEVYAPIEPANYERPGPVIRVFHLE